jgi:hypothetical protein
MLVGLGVPFSAALCYGGSAMRSCEVEADEVE